MQILEGLPAARLPPDLTAIPVIFVYPGLI
jgi:hypothetical protein